MKNYIATSEETIKDDITFQTALRVVYATQESTDDWFGDLINFDTEEEAIEDMKSIDNIEEAKIYKELSIHFVRLTIEDGEEYEVDDEILNFAELDEEEQAEVDKYFNHEDGVLQVVTFEGGNVNSDKLLNTLQYSALKDFLRANYEVEYISRGSKYFTVEFKNSGSVDFRLADHRYNSRNSITSERFISISIADFNATEDRFLEGNRELAYNSGATLEQIFSDVADRLNDKYEISKK